MSALCRQAALRFIKIRPRSIAELKTKLERKSFEPQEVQETLNWLKNNKLLDDRTFTKSWIQYRLGRPFGFRRIILELKEKGIDQSIIDEEIALIKGETNESQTALELAQRRIQRLNSIDPGKRKRRLFDFLSRRGYSPDIVMKVLKIVC